jgi:hypothetical protein
MSTTICLTSKCLKGFVKKIKLYSDTQPIYLQDKIWLSCIGGSLCALLIHKNNCKSCGHLLVYNTKGIDVVLMCSHLF